jgi:hypothetical protein
MVIVMGAVQTEPGGLATERESKMTKKLMITVVAMVMAVPTFASAQSTVQATAVVDNYFALVGTDVLDFGVLSRSANTTIDAAGGVGSVIRGLSYNHNLTVTYASVPASLTATVNGNGVSLPVSLTCAYRIGAAAWSSDAPCSTASFDLDVGMAITSADLGFGGQITAANTSNAVAATYTGQFDIVITAR